MNKQIYEYKKNEVLNDMLSSLRDVLNEQNALIERGVPDYGEDQMRGLRKRIHEARELEIAWMTLQDMIDLEDKYSLGVIDISKAGSEWDGLCQRARELFNP